MSFTINVLEFNLNSRVDQVLKLLIENNLALVEVGNVSLFNDYTTRYYKPSYGSVSRYLFEQLYIDETYIKSFPAPDGVMILEREEGENWEFVTVHDTATLTGTVEAIIASSLSSIHYAVGDGKVYRGTPEQYIGGHAGDGYVPNSFEWIPTGVVATNDEYPVFDMVKKGDKYYYTVNGCETNIEVPTEGTRIITNPSKENFTHLGPTWKIVDGEYYMGKTWACFTQVYNGAISSLGGNRNSIGIETCVNATGDAYDTWQRTAMLVADILIRNNLDVTRVKMHNTFSGKDCPQALIAGDFWWDFIEMVTVNYELMKNYSDVVIEFKSHNPEILSDNGHINYENAPKTTTVVSYDITVTIGGESRTITLSSIVKGTTCWEQWEGKYASSKIWNNGILQLDGNEETQKHSVQFLDKDGNVINEQFVYDGKDAVLIDAPKISGYKFSNWDKDYHNITTDTVIQAVYQQTSEVLNQYLVQFVDQNGTLLKEEYVYEGENATEPIVKIPSGYKYVGWDKDFTNIKENLVVKLILSAVDYSIVYYDGSQKLNLEPSSYSADFNESIVLPDGPEKEGYKFIGWFENNQKVVTFFTSDACNKVFYAKYEELQVGFKIPSDMTFMLTEIKKVPHSSGNGTFVYQPVLSGIDKNGNDYVLPSTSVLKWKWSSLNPEVATISAYSSITTVSLGYAILKAIYVDDESIIGYVVIKTTSEGVILSNVEEANKKELVTVTFKGMNGEIIDVQKIEKGATAVIPNIPVYDGYAFIGWDKNHFGIEEDTIINAKYVEGSNPFTNKTVSILGDSISTFNGYIPDGYAAFYPYATADLVDVNQTWWMQVINSLGMKLLKNNSYSGTYVIPSSNSTSSDSRLQNLLDGNQIPDVIIIYMGTNDCGTGSVDKAKFLEAYKTMLEKIKALCPNSEIYLMTLTPSGLCESSKRDEFNQVIKDYSVDYHLIDVSNVYTYDEYRNYVVDACHPNKAGMDILAKKIIEELLREYLD